MYLPLQEPFLDELLRNMGSHAHNQDTTSAYVSDGSLSHGYDASFENFPYDASPASQDVKPSIMSLDYQAVPIDIPSTALVDPSFTPPTTMAFTQNPTGSSPSSSSSSSSSSHSHSSSYSSSSSFASSWGDSTPWTMWSKVHSGVPSAVGHGSYYANVRDQELSNNHSVGYPPDGLNPFSGGLATSPGANAKGPSTEAVDVGQGQYNVIRPGSLVHLPDLRRHRYEQAGGDQIGESRTSYDRRFTCTFNNCGKSFSGEWEKARHFKSIHGPPTIGCRVCNYKQSRKDLFTEHCRKRHPGQSIEELMVQLVQNNGISPSP